MFRAIRFLWKMVKWALLVAVALFVLVVLINLRDEPLSDEARALLETKPITVPDNENIFVAMAGFDAPEGGDIFEYGRKHIEESEKRLVGDPSGRKALFESLKKPESPDSHEDKKELRWQEASPRFDCQLDKETNFLECARSQKDRLNATLAANETLIQRYHLLQELPHYVVPQNPNVWLTSGFSKTGNVRKTLLAQALLNMESKDAKIVKDGLTFFKKDMALWRRILERKNFLIDSMVATAQITNNVSGLSLLLSSPSTKVEKYAAEWRELLAPLSHEQSRSRPAIEREIKLIHLSSPGWKEGISYQDAKIYSEAMKKTDFACPAWQWWLEQNVRTFFFQPNATFNYSVPIFEAWLKLSDLSWKDYLVQRDAVLTPLYDLSDPSIGWIYNPVGKDYSKYPYLYDDYVGRLHDLDTYLRLVRLQLELRLAKIPSDEIPAFIEHLDEPYCAPCSDFSWVAETRMLSFQPYAKHGLSRQTPPSVYVPEAR
ncbi:MAG: hypothetical protein LBB65_01030 [Burkholderiales bacterium]|jgi:hypothetical protein|nr:hypothetical protein [Burkholderiales bacterium]